MLRFLLRRLLVAIPTLFLVVTVAFFMMRAAPGSPFDMDRKLAPEVEANVMAKYGMDRPLPEQYVNYLADAVRGDFGPSLKYKDKTVLDVLRENYAVSLKLGLSAIILAAIVGISLGVIAALRQNRAADYLTMAIAILGVCIPTFVTAPLLVLAFASKLGWLPTAGWNNGALLNMVLPITVLALPQIAIISRLTRAGMIEVLRSNYVRTARSKGLGERQILYGHVFRNAMLIVVAGFPAAFIGVLFTGSLLIEVIFSLDGLGLLGFEAAINRDYPVMFGTLFFFTLLGLLLGIVGDLMYVAIDPRIDFEARRA